MTPGEARKTLLANLSETILNPYLDDKRDYVIADKEALEIILLGSATKKTKNK